MTFVENYARRVDENPTALAIETRTRSGLQRLTRAELWGRAGTVAAALEAIGVGPESVVAVPYGRSSEFVVAVLGVWRARAGWVCLDPSLPEARRADFSRRARASASVQLVEGTVQVTEISPRVPKAVATGGQAAAVAEVTGEPASDLAYVVFTSGSSGRPKGVRVEQRGLVPMLLAQIAAFDLRPESRCLWILSPSFDATVSDVGVALLSGATLLIDAPEIVGDPARLVTVLADRGVTFIDLPPSLLPHLDLTRIPQTLRTVVIGGETVDVVTARRWAERVQLVNVYGPTEATVCTSIEQCLPTWRGRTLGQPMPHVRYRIEDEELWIGGDCLARDYADDAEETARSFVCHEGERWYRTGDRVEREGDEWLFRGRIDRQVKIGGKRAEPEEIEAALARIGVASVVMPHTVDGQTTLTAFVESDRGAAAGTAWVGPENVRLWTSALSSELPMWLLPRRWVVVRAVPRTESGKVDLAALAALPMPMATSAALTDPLERRLAELFAEVLDGAAVGRDDDFFALGGDSLTLLALLSRAELAGIALSASMVRTHPSVALLAVALHAGSQPEIRTTYELLAHVPDRVLTGPTRATGSRLLLTGATGFLGTRLHRELIARGHDVIAVVRACDDQAARRRLDGDYAAIAGDLALPRFGLSDSRWQQLLDEVGGIVHLAANVNLAGSLESLFAANVAGTAHVLELATASGAHLVHASTLSVFVASDRSDAVFFEDDDAGAPCTIAGGYAQSKWVAERAVRDADVPGAIVRYGLLTGDRATGVSPPSDWLVRFVRALAVRGALPAEMEAMPLAFDATPVDHAVAATCAIVDAATDRLETYHVAASRPVEIGRLVAAMRAEGVSVVSREDDDWPEASAVLGLARTALRERFERHRALDLFAATDVRFDDRNARAIGIAAPAVDDAYLRRCVRWMLSDMAHGVERSDR